MIGVKYWGGLVKLTGKKDEEINTACVRGVLDYIQVNYGKQAKKEAKRMLIAVNGTNIQHLQRFKTILHDGDNVTFLPLSAGG